MGPRLLVGPYSMIRLLVGLLVGILIRGYGIIMYRFAPVDLCSIHEILNISNTVKTSFVYRTQLKLHLHLLFSSFLCLD